MALAVGQGKPITHARHVLYTNTKRCHRVPQTRDVNAQTRRVELRLIAPGIAPYLLGWHHTLRVLGKPPKNQKRLTHQADGLPTARDVVIFTLDAKVAII